jgi:Domain of unknown function (DUF4124)
MRRIVIVAMMLMAGSAQAQVVYKCVGKNGHVEFSSWPCASDKRTVKTVAAPADPVRPYTPPVPRQQPQQVVTNTFYNGPTQPTAREAAMQRCANAKQWRADELRRLGLKRTFNDLRRVDDWVNQQCAGL